jgi:hypothetical protein
MEETLYFQQLHQLEEELVEVPKDPAGIPGVQVEVGAEEHSPAEPAIVPQPAQVKVMMEAVV